MIKDNKSHYCPDDKEKMRFLCDCIVGKRIGNNQKNTEYNHKDETGHAGKLLK